MNSLLSLQNGSDVRGVSMEGVPGENVNLTEIQAKSIAVAFTKWLSAKFEKPVTEIKISIGRDSRITGPQLTKGATDGIIASGAHAYDCGIASTPSMFMSTLFDDMKFDGAIMITASHLPFNRNGMKFFTNLGGLDKKDITEILTMATDIENGKLTFESDKPGKESLIDLIQAYSDHLVNIIRREVNDATHYEQPLKGFNIIVDAGNGAGGFFTHKVLEQLGANTAGSQFLDPDGTFPNHIPNPEDKEAMNSIQSAVIQHNSDLGIIFDTDVDRAAVVDKGGNIINRNRLIALLSAIVLSEHPDSTIVTDSVTSDGLNEFIQAHGGKHHRFKRGYKNVINESVRLNAVGEASYLAIETSGHGAFKENYFLDDGAYIITKILIQMSRLKASGQSLSEMIASLKEPAQADEFRIKIAAEDFLTYGNGVIEDLKAYIADVPEWSMVPENFEGIRVNWDIDGHNGWFLLRMSLHDPVLPLNVESETEDGIEAIKPMLIRFFEKYEALNIDPLKA